MTDRVPSQPIARPLPRWRRYSLVSAIRIKSIVETPDSTQAALIFPADPSYPPIPVHGAYLREYSPAPGGFFVINENGDPEYTDAVKFEREYAPYMGGGDGAGPDPEDGK